MSIIKGMMGMVVAVPLAGAAMGGVGSAFTGSLAGIGGATQVAIGGGLLGHASKMFKW